MDIRCPFCKEALSISQKQVDSTTECPRCKKTFVWGDILRAKERKEQEAIEAAAEKKRLRKAKREERKVLQAEKAASAKERVRESREERKMRMREERWQCEECGRDLCQLDFQRGTGFYDNEVGAAYCEAHAPEWLFAREERYDPGYAMEAKRISIWVPVCIVIAALMIVGGYIAYAEYNRGEAKKPAGQVVEKPAQPQKQPEQKPKCRICGGTGWLDCTACAGTGRDRRYPQGCPKCNGTGKVKCWSCGGTGIAK